MFSWFKTVFLGVCVMILTVPANATTLESLDSIEQAAYIFALQKAQASYDNPQVVVDSLDSRLRLQQCAVGLDTFISNNNNGANQTVGVQCDRPVKWTVYVPVRVKVMEPVVVAARPLGANHILTAGDLKIAQMDINSLHQSYHKRISKVVGMQLKYPLSVGMVIRPSSIKRQKIVKRGDQITLVAKAGAMEVRMSGVAMADASIGQKVRVKNSSSSRIVEGVVNGPGVVMVNM